MDTLYTQTLWTTCIVTYTGSMDTLYTDSFGHPIYTDSMDRGHPVYRQDGLFNQNEDKYSQLVTQSLYVYTVNFPNWENVPKWTQAY